MQEKINLCHYFTPLILIVNEEDFCIHVELILAALTTKNERILLEFKEVFTNLISADYFKKVFQMAMQRLEKIDTVAYYWAMQHKLDNFTYNK